MCQIKRLNGGPFYFSVFQKIDGLEVFVVACGFVGGENGLVFVGEYE